jgi:hypothetical protein
VWLALACTPVNFDRGGALVLKGKGDASCGFCTPPYEHAKVYKTLLLHKFSPLHALLTLQVRGNSKLSTAVLFVFNMLRTNGPEKTPKNQKTTSPHTRIDCYIIPSKIRKLRPSSCSLLSPSQESYIRYSRKALPGFLLCIFSSITCLNKPVLRPYRPRAQISNHGRTCTQALPASGTDLKSRKDLYSGPSPRSSTYIKHKMHGPTKHKTNVQASHKTKEH